MDARDATLACAVEESGEYLARLIRAWVEATEGKVYVEANRKLLEEKRVL